jgi:hypothetical protein
MVLAVNSLNLISEVIESSLLNLVPGLGCVYIFSTATPVCVHIYTHQYLGETQITVRGGIKLSVLNLDMILLNLVHM